MSSPLEKTWKKFPHNSSQKREIFKKISKLDLEMSLISIVVLIWNKIPLAVYKFIFIGKAKINIIKGNN